MRTKYKRLKKATLEQIYNMPHLLVSMGNQILLQLKAPVPTPRRGRLVKTFLRGEVKLL